MHAATEHYLALSFQSSVDKLLGIIPSVIGFILLIIIGWIFAKIVKTLIRKLLNKLQFDQAIQNSSAGTYVTRVMEHPGNFLAKLAYWIILLGFILFAVSSLGVPALTLIVNGIYRYIPNVIAAIIIFLIASALTAGAEAFVVKALGKGTLAKLVGAIVPAIILPIAIFMILDQLHIAKNIVDITYTALVGSVALGLALAFGLGGRDVASRILEQAYDTTQAKSGQLQSEYQQAKGNAQQSARDLRRKAK